MGALISFVYDTDPSKASFGTNQIAALKYFPFVLSALSLLCFMLSNSVRRAVSWPVLALSLFVILELMGGGVAHFILHEPLEETLLGRALGGIVFFAFVALACNQSELEYFLRKFFWGSLIFSLIMIAELILFRMGMAFQYLSQMFHVDIVLLVSCALLAKYLVVNSRIRQILMLLGILAGLISGKATGVLVAILILGVIVIDENKRLSKSLQKMRARSYVSLKGMQSTSVVVIVLSLAAAFSVAVDSRMNAQEDKVRMHTFELRFNEFMDSPWVGQFFAGNPLVEAGGGLYIPSHSDLIDLLAFGGALSILLFYLPIMITVKRWLMDNHSLFEDLRNYFAVIVLSFLLVMLVNPVFAVPRVIFFFWMALGLSVLPFAVKLPPLSKRLAWG